MLVGMKPTGSSLQMVEFEDLWRIPGDCDAKNVIACKLTTTSTNSTIPRGYLEGTMVYLDNGAQGLLVLFGGLFRGDMVRTCFVILFLVVNQKTSSCLQGRKQLPPWDPDAMHGIGSI